MQHGSKKKKIHDEELQKLPGLEAKMHEKPVYESNLYKPGKKLEGKAALITGGDSGIGKATAIAFAQHGADIGICYLPAEEQDALNTQKIIQDLNKKCVLFPGSISSENHCQQVLESFISYFGKINILVNNAATQQTCDSIEKISENQLKETFNTNVFPMFYFAKAALAHLNAGDSIINTASVTAYRGSAHLLDYAASKGAIVSFTRSLAGSLVKKGIRVNAVAPGPVWTPLIVASMNEEELSTFGSDSPMGRPAQPVEIASCFVFLASEDASYISGQVLHPNGGEIVNG